MTDESTIDNKFRIKKFVSKIVIAGLGIDFVYRVSIWTGLQEKIKNIVSK